MPIKNFFIFVLFNPYPGPKSPGLIVLEHELSNQSAQAFMTAYPDIIANGWTMMSAPAETAARRAPSMSLTRYPVRSLPNGYGIGVVNAKTESAPTGDVINRHSVLLGVGVTVSNCIVNSELCSLNGADYIIHAPKAALSAARTTGVILHEPIHCLTHYCCCREPSEEYAATDHITADLFLAEEISASDDVDRRTLG